MTVTIRRLVCWCLMLILPMQAMAGMVRLHVPNADPAHETLVAQLPHGAGVRQMTADHHALAAHESLPSRSDCGHHAAPPCPDCHGASDESHDPSDRHASCNACTLCCLLLIPALLTVASPAAVSSIPPERDAHFRSVAPHVLERPPRLIAVA